MKQTDGASAILFQIKESWKIKSKQKSLSCNQEIWSTKTNKLLECTLKTLSLLCNTILDVDSHSLDVEHIGLRKV